MSHLITEYPQFFTATIKVWYNLLLYDKYKDILIGSFRFLDENKRIHLHVFVIMPNHVHLIWQMQPLIHPSHVQCDFLKYTAQQIKRHLKKTDLDTLGYFEVAAADRQYQFWKRRSLSIELRTDRVYQQKLNYIHYNPVKAELCKYPEEYTYSSSSFYHTGIDNSGFLTHYRG